MQFPGGFLPISMYGAPNPQTFVLCIFGGTKPPHAAQMNSKLDRKGKQVNGGRISVKFFLNY